jgi:hypothetical protein
MKPLIIILLCLISSLLSAQEEDPLKVRIRNLKNEYPNLPILSKEAMYQDFDSLCAIIKNCNPQYLVVKKATGFDIIKEMLLLRQNIEYIDNTMDFVKLLNKALNYNMDTHACLSTQVWYFRSMFYQKEIELNQIPESSFAYTFYYSDSIFRDNAKTAILLYYTNGDYYFKYNTTLYTENDSVMIEAGSKILLLNSVPVTKLLNEEKKFDSGYDFDYKLFYIPRLTLSLPVNTIQYESNGKAEKVVFTLFKEERRIFNFAKYYVSDIKWLHKDSILYFRLPLMDRRFVEQLKDSLVQLKNQPIKAFVVDIRENWGGDDSTWIQLLGMIYDTAFTFQSSLLVNDTKEVQLRYPESLGKKKYDMLDSSYYFNILEDEVVVINPDSANMGYRGKIYILVDDEIASSAQSFASLSVVSPYIKTVGIPTGRYGGRGATPSVFHLPNSGFIFTLNIMLDDVNVQNIRDFYHDKVSYPVIPSVRYLKFWNNPQRPYVISETDLYNQDDMFLRTLDIIKNDK